MATCFKLIRFRLSRYFKLSNLGPVFGLVFVLVGFVIIGGLKVLQKSLKIVPFMAVMCVGASLIIILVHFSDIGFVISEIINCPFLEAGLGGVIGF